MPRDTTVAEAIYDVLEGGKEPLLAKEIFLNLPQDRLVKEVNYKTFWQHFGMMLKRKRYKIDKTQCPDSKRVEKGKGELCLCYRLIKRI